MKKIIDFNNIEKYFCLKCNHFHKKSKKNNFNRHQQYKKETKSNNRYYCNVCECTHTKSKFKQHETFAFKLSSTELWKYHFKKNWNKYDLSKEIGK